MMAYPSQMSSSSLSHVERVIACLQQRSKRNQCDNALAPYLKAARWVALSISPFASMKTVFYAVLPRTKHNPESTDEDRAVYEAIMDLVPTFRNIIHSFSQNPKKFDDFIKKISRPVAAGRNANTASLKHAIVDYMCSELTRDIEPQITPAHLKNMRGFNHQATAILLCPARKLIQCLNDPRSRMDGLISGRRSGQRLCTVRAFDPNNEDIGLCRGEILDRVYRHIFTGPSSALSKYKAVSKASKAQLHDLSSVTGRTIAYAAVQARIAISAAERWGRFDGDFDNEAFFRNIVTLFEDDPKDEWVIDTLHWWNKNVPCLAPRSLKRKRDTPDSNSSDSGAVAIIFAQRKALQKRVEKEQLQGTSHLQSEVERDNKDPVNSAGDDDSRESDDLKL